MIDKRPIPSAPRLAAIRERWVNDATIALRNDPLVCGAALVGSLGAGRADDWSDVDLLVVVEDAELDEHATADRLPNGSGLLTFAIDARQNGPLGTRAVSAQYVVDGLPLWVDWHIHPVSLAKWPSDSTVLFSHRDISGTPAILSAYPNHGDHEPATPKTPDEEQAMRLALVPIAGKQLARRSPEFARTIEFLGGTHDANRNPLDVLRQLLNQAPSNSNPASLTAGHAYIDLLEDTLR